MSVDEPRPVGEIVTPSRQSLLALSWLNFFLAGMQSAFGPIAAAYLAAQRWTAKDIGFVLGIGGIASLVSQVPGGELLDAVRTKPLLIAISVISIALSTLLFRLWPSFVPVAVAQVLPCGIDNCAAGNRGIASALGRTAGRKRGRKPLLLVGFAALPVRAVLFALVSDPFALVVVQVLDGISGAVLGIMTALIIADVTKSTGRFISRKASSAH